MLPKKMRLLKQDVVKDLSGYMRLQADEPEDMVRSLSSTDIFADTRKVARI